MKVLYLCNEYYGSKVHRNLCEGLARLGVSLQVYTYMSDSAKSGLNAFESNRTRFYYRPVLKRWHRFFYHLKVRRVCSDLLHMVDTESVDLILATTTFTDGAVARLAAQQLGVPYLVMARNTDVNTFLRYMPHTWIAGRRIVRHAARVICISPSIERRFRSAWLFRGTGLEQKCLMQANGIDDFWIEGIRGLGNQGIRELGNYGIMESGDCGITESPNSRNSVVPTSGHRLLYVGVFNINKNVARLCTCVLRLRQRYPDIQLGLVGGGGSMSRRVARYVNRYPDHFVYYGRITDKQQLKDIYNQHSLFAMPSIHETFGLVYLEAMSQNLPVIYTRGQGIDGLFADEIGERVDAFSGRQIQAAVARIFDCPERYHPSEAVDFEQFRWSSIALRYKALLQSVASE